MKAGSLIARFALLAVPGRAMPPAERMLLEERVEAGTRIEGSRGPLFPERSAAILERLKARSAGASRARCSKRDGAACR